MTPTTMIVLDNSTNWSDSPTDVPSSPITSAQPLPCNNTLEVTFWILGGIVGFIVAMGNITTLIVLVTSSRLQQRVMNLFLGSLALADVGMGLMVFPGYGVYCSGCTYSFSAYCWILKGPKDVFVSASILNLLAITYDRYTAVKRPLHYTAKMTHKRVRIILSAVWGLSLTIAVGPNFWQHAATPEQNGTINSIYYATLTFALVIIPILFLLVVNLLIISAIRQQIKQVGPSETSRVDPNGIRVEPSGAEAIRRRKGTISCVLVVLIFVIAWIPRTTYNVINLFGGSRGREPIFTKVSLFFLTLQSAVNPFVYSFLRSDFRKAAIRLFKCEKA